MTAKTPGAGGSRFAYSAREQSLFNAAREVARTHAPPTDTPLTADALKSVFRALAPLGYLHSVLPPNSGGNGLSAMEFAAIVDGLSPVLPLVGNHSVQRYLHGFGSRAQRERFLPGLFSGEEIGAIAITEPHAGSNLGAVTTTARREGKGYVIEGCKTWVTHGMDASVFIVLARTPGDGDKPGFTRFIVPADTPGLTRRPMATIGLRHLRFAQITFDACEIDLSVRLGAEGSGAEGAKDAFPIARALAALQAVGIAEAALDLACDYAQTRAIPKGTLADSSLIQDGYAELRARCEASRLLALKVMDNLAADSAVASASAAKALACRLALSACRWASDCAGSSALDAVHPLQRLGNDARMMAVVDGTPVLNNLVFARRTIAQKARSEQEPAA